MEAHAPYSSSLLRGSRGEVGVQQGGQLREKLPGIPKLNPGLDIWVHFFPVKQRWEAGKEVCRL